MEGNVVAVCRGEEKLAALDELIELSGFDAALEEARVASGKEKRGFHVVIKPNMMVFINPKGHTATVTDKDLVEHLVDRVREAGFTRIPIVEAQNDVGRMLKNHNVRFVAEQIEEVFPWDLIDPGPSRHFLRNEYVRSQKGVTTPYCEGPQCNNCGIDPSLCEALKKQRKRNEGEGVESGHG